MDKQEPTEVFNDNYLVFTSLILFLLTHLCWILSRDSIC